MLMTPYGDPSRGHTAEETSNFYGYTVARAVRLYGVEFHAAVQMGNHHHNNITDVHANRPNYKNSVHSNLARGFNARFGRFDSVWQGGGSCDTITASDEETLDDLAYADCNPVEAGLVKWGHLWPGFSTYGWRFGETRSFYRPRWYYDPDNPDNSAVIELTRVRPRDIFPDLSDDELSDLLFERCRQIERKKHASMKAANRRFRGLKKLRRTKWWECAKSPEERFVSIPGIATRDRGKRLQQVRRLVGWRRTYGVRLDAIRRGEPAQLPYGAYMLPRIYSVPVEAEPP